MAEAGEDTASHSSSKPCPHPQKHPPPCYRHLPLGCQRVVQLCPRRSRHTQCVAWCPLQRQLLVRVAQLEAEGDLSVGEPGAPLGVESRGGGLPSP